MRRKNRELENACARCGKRREGPLTFWIGAAKDAHAGDEAGGFVMVEGTGRLVCADCYPAESEEGQRGML